MPRKPVPRDGLPVYAVAIRALLRQRDMTHANFAKATGLSRQATYSALNGGDLKVSNLMKMAQALEVEPHVLLRDPNRPAAVPEPQRPNPFIELLEGLVRQPAPSAIPGQLQEVLNLWGKLTPRDIAAIVSILRGFAENRVVDARYVARLDSALTHH